MNVIRYWLRTIKISTVIFVLSYAMANRINAQDIQNVNKLGETENIFGFQVFRKLVQADKASNLFISPFSLHSCLQMAYNGASGKTADEMAKILKLSPTQNKEDYQQLIKQLKVVEIANSIWGNKNTNFRPDFIAMTQKYFQAEVRSLDFSDSNSVSVINSWVSNKTHGKIPSIITQLNPLDLVILINAAYFKAPWCYQFDKSDTKPVSFYTANGKTKPVPMMNLCHNFLYAENADFQSIQLPYKDETSMYVFLPRDRSGLDKFLEKLNMQNWNAWNQKLSRHKVNLSMPKFTLSYNVICNQILSQLGMKVAFENKADFSNMIMPPPAVYISRVLHKTFIKVDENGTEAAASTAIIMPGGARPLSTPAKPFKMVIDHPFFFAIVNNTTGTILFMGTISDPT